MTTTAWYVNKPFFLPLLGGADFDFGVTLQEIQKTSLDGKVTEVRRGAPFDFTGWSAFYVALTPDGSSGVSKVASLTLDGPPENGTLRLRGKGTQTWDLQGLGYLSGRTTLLGKSPAGARSEIASGHWSIVPGATAPSVPYVSDWTILR